MADWTSPLPETAVEGETTHIEDHNAIVAAIAEARTVVDAAQATIASLQGLLDGKADDEHKHAAADVTSGTFDAARIPTLEQSKVSGLSAALNGKQDAGNYATADQVEAKADQTALDALEARVSTLEGAGA